MAKRIGIIYCERIQDASCVGCAKCYKAVNENAFAFEGLGDVRIVFKTGCGDCPGLVVPKVDLQMTVLEAFDVGVDEICVGTCVKKATALMNCPMNVEGVTRVLEDKFGVPVQMGTHDY
ncbi:MAG: CGGC domain-containing protein [Acidobacteriota bacterium]|nr:CGGC domain-containing protein [Acidobacteriota bacterium]